MCAACTSVKRGTCHISCVDASYFTKFSKKFETSGYPCRANSLALTLEF